MRGYRWKLICFTGGGSGGQFSVPGGMTKPDENQDLQRILKILQEIYDTEVSSME